jgi:putative inorganic carbon (hco3(-)) transporter
MRRATHFLTQLELWVVGSLVVVSIAWSGLLTAAVVTAAVFWLIRKAAYGHWTVRTPADGPILVVIGMSLVSLAITALPELTHLQVLRLWSGIALYYAIVNWVKAPARLTLLQAGLIGFGLALVAVAPFTVKWAFDKLPFLPKDLSTHFSVLVQDSIHPNVLGGTLALLLPISLAAFLFYKWRNVKQASFSIFAFLASAVMAVMLLLSLARGGLLAFGIAALFLIMFRWKYGWLLTLVAILAGVFLAIQYVNNPYTEVNYLLYRVFNDLSSRTQIWERALIMVEDFPFTGIGMGSFMQVLDRFYPLGQPNTIIHAHNLFLQVAIDLGIPGLIAWLAILGSIFFQSWQAYRVGQKTQNALLSALGAGLFCSQIALCIHGLTDVTVWGVVRSSPFLWALWGAAAAAGIIARQVDQQLAPPQAEVEHHRPAPLPAGTEAEPG